MKSGTRVSVINVFVYDVLHQPDESVCAPPPPLTLCLVVILIIMFRSICCFPLSLKLNLKTQNRPAIMSAHTFL